jgi:hypothetical protein
MNLSIAEIFLLCWAITVTGFYLVERSNLNKYKKFMDFVMTGVANKQIDVSEDEDGRIHVKANKS